MGRSSQALGGWDAAAATDVDTNQVLRNTPAVLRPGASRQRLARTLNAAYAHGLLSEKTLSYRLDLLFGDRLVDPTGLVGDLTRRVPCGRWRGRLGHWRATALAIVSVGRGPDAVDPLPLLALDWNGNVEELLVGRAACSDVLLGDLSVSRHHARLVFRDGSWVIQDLGSTNGTRVNGVTVGRCELRPGDRIAFGDERLRID
jgi:FHA domain